MSYALSGLGALAPETYNAGTQLAAGYRIDGLVNPAGEVPGLLRQAMEYGFRGRTVRTGWGGGSDAAGIPSGVAYAIVETARDGVTADEMNRIFSNVGANLQTRLRGGRVSNTHAHVARRAGGSAATAPSAPAPAGAGAGKGSPSGSSPSDFLTAFTTPGTPSTPYVPDGSMTPSYYPTEESFFTTTYGGIPGWGLLVGGALLVGGIGYMALQSRRPAAVKANRPRRRRRSRRRRAARGRSTGKRRRPDLSRNTSPPFWYIQGSVVGPVADAFSSMPSEDRRLLEGRYKTEAQAQRAMDRLKEKYGRHISFHLKERMKW